MSRIAYDCIGANAQWVRDNLPLPDVMFFYGTGSTGIDWTDVERLLFPASIMVEIDQGGQGSPVSGRRVLDVENGAWTVLAAVDEARADKGVIALYGSRSTLEACAAAGYQGPFWLAWPGWAGDPLPVHPGIVIVAVQNSWQQNYDESQLLDPSWPFGLTVPPSAGNLSVTVHSRSANLEAVTSMSPDHVVIEFQEGPSATPVVIGRVSPVRPGVPFHIAPLVIPEGKGGRISAYAIVHGTAFLIGKIDL